MSHTVTTYDTSDEKNHIDKSFESKDLQMKLFNTMKVKLKTCEN